MWNTIKSKSFENSVPTNGSNAFENPLHDDDKDSEMSKSNRVNSNDNDVPTPDFANSNFKEMLPVEFVDVKENQTSTPKNVNLNP